MASAVIRSFHLVAAILAAGSLAAQAQTAAPKAWADPGAAERAASPNTAPAEPAKAGADPKQAASDSEKLKELIRAAEASSDADKAKKAGHTSGHAHHVTHAHAAAPKKVAAKPSRHPASHPIAYEYLPNKKDGPVVTTSGPISAAY